MPPRPKELSKHKIRIKRNDQVLVVAGKDAGKKGRVLRVLAERNRVLVEGVMMIKKHVKPTQQRQQGGIVEQEASIHISNVMLVDAAGNPTRTGTRVEGNKRVRFAKTTGAVLPVKSGKR